VGAVRISKHNKMNANKMKASEDPLYLHHSKIPRLIALDRNFIESSQKKQSQPLAADDDDDDDDNDNDDSTAVNKKRQLA
jgi:hypothetical protein